MGFILFGLVFGYLALVHGQHLFQSPFLLVVELAMLVGLVVLCEVYFFRLPLTGVCISLGCYLASIALSWLTMRSPHRQAFRVTFRIKWRASVNIIWPSWLAVASGQEAC
jgi:hypothetical protein